MKYAMVLFAAAFFVIGCADQSSVNPVASSDVSALGKSFTPPAHQEGKLPVQQWLSFAGDGYYVAGEVSYTYDRSGVTFDFKSETSFSVEKSTGKTIDAFQIDEARDDNGFTRIPTIVNRYPLKGNAVLVVTISVRYPVSIASVTVEDEATVHNPGRVD